MDGFVSFAGDYQEQRSPGHHAGPPKPAMRTDLFAMGYDLLAVWDMLTIGAAGLICATASRGSSTPATASRVSNTTHCA